MLSRLSRNHRERRSVARNATVTDHETFTRMMLEDHTVPQMVHQAVPIRSGANINPLMRRLPNPHRKHACLPVSENVVRGATREAAVYQMFHQLQCPSCQCTSAAEVDHACNAVFQDEKSARFAVASTELDERAVLFRAMKRGAYSIDQRRQDAAENESRAVVAVSASQFLQSLEDELSGVQSEEASARKLHAVSILREQRCLHAVLLDTLRGGSFSPKDVASRVSSALSRLSELAESTYAQCVAEHSALCSQVIRRMCIEERTLRFQVEDEFFASCALLDLASVEWRLLASRSMEERKASERVTQRSVVLQAETRMRAVLQNEEDSAFLGMQTSLRLLVQEAMLKRVAQSITVLLGKEERIRSDKKDVFLGEREQLLLRVVHELSSLARTEILRLEAHAYQGLQREHQLWLSGLAETDDALGWCRTRVAKLFVEGILVVYMSD